MSKDNEIGVRLKCLELAVLSMEKFPAFEVHKLALYYQEFIATNEWPYEKIVKELTEKLNDEGSTTNNQPE